MINHTDTKKMKSLKTTTTNTTKKQQQKKKTPFSMSSDGIKMWQKAATFKKK